jgi:hypothetical protein
MIVVGIARDARHFGRLDEFDDLEIISEHVACGFADERSCLDAPGRLRTLESSSRSFGLLKSCVVGCAASAPSS